MFRSISTAVGVRTRSAGECSCPGRLPLLQCLRFWVIWTLGSRWTTRIIVLPGQPLVSAGPYRFLSHPNYAVVAGEIAVLPLVLGLPLLAVVFTILNATALAIRIWAENRALAASRETLCVAHND